MVNLFEGDNPFLGVVFANPTVPTSSGVFYSVHPTIVTGTQAESGSGIITPISSVTDLVLILGTTPCVAGDLVVYYRAENRWVGERYAGSGGGGGTHVQAGCPCGSVPNTLTMTVTNGGPGFNNGIFNSCVFAWGPTPSSLLPVVLIPNSWLSTGSFPDPILGVPFFYFLTCSLGAYVLTRVYVTSPFGSPFRDSIRYKWVPGFPGNTCTPFVMTNGQIFAGGNPATVCTLP
jgi:hypothetical protein